MGKCGALQFIVLQRVGHELATEQIVILRIPQCPDFHNFMISLENRYSKSFNYVLLQNCFGFSRSLAFS